MGEGFIGFSHFVDIFTFFDSSTAAVGSIDNFGGKFVAHGFFRAQAGIRNEPTDSKSLAAFVSAHAVLPEVPDPGYRIDRRDVTGSGDIALMLDLPGGQSLYPPETVWVRRVLAPDGAPWRPSRPADVLLLGDSFTNIYSLATMGWGDAAGFAEQLSYALGRPLDRIVQNDEGAFATRALLARELAAGRDRLAGTRVVIYQFATRELAFGDWRVIELPDSR